MKNQKFIIILAIIVAFAITLIVFPQTFGLGKYQDVQVEDQQSVDLISSQTQMETNKDLNIEVVKEGAGKAVEVGDTLRVHYVGTLTDGVEFDNSRKRGQPLEFKLGTTPLIKGFEEGVIGMHVGEIRRLIISPEYAYGVNSGHPLENQTLVFEVELVEIVE